MRAGVSHVGRRGVARTEPLAIAALWLGATAALALALVWAPSRFTSLAHGIVTPLAGCALALQWGLAKFPDFERRTIFPTAGLFALSAAGLGTLLTPGGGFVSALLGALLLIAVVSASRRTRRAARICRLLSRPVAQPRAGAFGVFVGRVLDATPILVGGEPAAIAQLDTLTGTGEDTGVDTEMRGFDSRFVVRTGSVELEVNPKDIVWHSDVITHREATWAWLVPIGAEVVVAGTPELDAGGRFTLRSTGAESLVLYASAPGTDVRAAVVRALRARRLVLGLGMLAVAAAAAMATLGITRWD
ncbi:MAG: hypothetical protein KIT31_09380 [Deltaproteobacteria bacterium]|nr:hypothetical protein [Deltaproteobacteria bacterium]